MSRFSVEILPEAEADLREAFGWYSERSPLAADAFRSLMLEAIDALADNADSWPENEDGVRFRVLRRFPYTLYYELAGGMATLIAVAHQRRMPRYWSGRRSGGSTDA